MPDLKIILLEHMKLHPGFTIRDAAKLIYQNEFGGGHLIRDPDGALRYLRHEMETCPSGTFPLYEPIGNGLVRLDLRPASGLLSPETVFRLFYLSSRSARGDRDIFRQKLSLLYDLGFDRGEVDAFLDGYAAAGYPMLSHSETYRAANSPAYRVVEERYVMFIDLLSAVDRLSRFAGPVIVGVDGMCASGKTTLGMMLSEIYDANVFHADDYFLPPNMRTPERLSLPGGNMHRERLADEVLEPLSRGENAVTRRFDCQTCTFSPPHAHPSRRVNIVEGSYVLHRELRDFYTLKAALRTTPERQLERLRVREARLEDFVSRWIPLENAYFTAHGVYSDPDILVIDT